MFDQMVNNLVHNHVTQIIGNGQHTDFWHDPWLQGDSFVILYPRLYRLTTHVHDSVANILNVESCAWDLGLADT